MHSLGQPSGLACERAAGQSWANSGVAPAARDAIGTFHNEGRYAVCGDQACQPISAARLRLIASS